MTDRGAAPPADPYSPEHRTALILTGTGTAGAYHAGVLRALHEAGVKLDIVAGRGVGCVGALFAAVDGAQRLWDDNGFWRSPAVGAFYSWRAPLRLVVWALAVATALVAVPLVAMAAGLVVFPIDFVLKMMGAGGADGLTARYVALAEAVFAPGALPTWLPRLVLLVLGLTALLAAIPVWLTSTARRGRGRFWWRFVQSPLQARSAIEHVWTVLWDLIRGAAQLKPPAPVDLARRYTELLAENLGQPGFRELLLVAHDIDAHRDVVFALVGEGRRRDLIRRATSEEADARRAALVDLSGIGRDHLVDAVAAALTVPLANEWHLLTFAAESYWRGETHRLCDRPASLGRLIEELEALDVTQILLISAAPDPQGPHALAPQRLDGRGRLGEYLQSAEAAALRDATRHASGAARIFTIQPAHNPIGPFDLDGGFDDRSDRRQALAELVNRGYEDAFHQFVEPVLGASGEQLA